MTKWVCSFAGLIAVARAVDLSGRIISARSACCITNTHHWAPYLHVPYFSQQRTLPAGGTRQIIVAKARFLCTEAKT